MATAAAAAAGAAVGPTGVLAIAAAAAAAAEEEEEAVAADDRFGDAVPFKLRAERGVDGAAAAAAAAAAGRGGVSQPAGPARAGVGPSAYTKQASSKWQHFIKRVQQVRCRIATLADGEPRDRERPTLSCCCAGSLDSAP